MKDHGTKPSHQIPADTAQVVCINGVEIDKAVLDLMDIDPAFATAEVRPLSKEDLQLFSF